ncbi:translation initiation factor IF-2-like [Herpailurus yagouaroundi]|uniref:translation initiation factor IF-2-like n=1 Tax=Herpailurus yagouaroundi TaxID=1608482 RepID=UPI001AD71A47|nr:translation initiation factor IF-2-like [Puma yagouaroundi]
MSSGPGGRRGQSAELSMRAALDSSSDRRAGREPLRAVWEEGSEGACERRRGGGGAAGAGPVGEGGGGRRWVGEPGRPSRGGLGGASAGRGGGTAGPTRRPASGLSPQSPARNRRLGPGPARSGLPCRTLFGSTRTSFGKSSAPRGRLHSCTFIYCHLLQHLVPGRRERREEVEDMNGKRIHLLYVKSLTSSEKLRYRSL